MARLTELPPDRARALGHDFGLEVERVEALDEGSVNSNFRLTTREGARYFARIYEEQAAAGAEREHELVRALADSDVPVVQGLEQRHGGSLADFEGKAFAVFPWLDGEILCQRRVSPEVCKKLGAALARVHLASRRISPLAAGRFRVPDLFQRLEAVVASGRSELLPAVATIREKLTRYSGERSAELAQGICHGDLFRDNVLWRQGEIVALLDFESACWSNFAYDLGVTALAWCYGSEFDAGLVKALFSGYTAERPLPAAERRAFKTEAALGCLRFASTRLTDFSLRVPPGVRPIRDYARFLARLDAIERGVLDACLT